MAHHLLEKIKSISAAETWSLRHQVMWPHMPLNFVKIENDAQGFHFGLFVNEHLVSVVSLFISADNTGQFRKLATLQNQQGKGYGSKLLQHVFEFSKAKQVVKLWCNARADKLDFYRKFELTATKTSFQKENITFVILEKTL